MFQIANGMKAEVDKAAKAMVASDVTLAPLLSPDGSPMFYVATDKSQLRLTFGSTSVDGTTVYVGIPTGK